MVVGRYVDKKWFGVKVNQVNVGRYNYGSKGMFKSLVCVYSSMWCICTLGV